MSRQQVLRLGIAVSLVISFLVGCGGSAPTVVSEAPSATSAPEQATATPTAEPPTSTPEPPTATPVPPTATPIPPTPTPEPPTATPTPAVASPQPGATFSGDVEESQDVSGAIVNLELSEDGTSITTVTIGLLGPGQCGGVTLNEGGKFNSFISGPFPITEGDFNVSLPNGGELKGRFTSPTEASGTIRVVGLDFVDSCKFGPSNWNAKASALTSESSTSETPTDTQTSAVTNPQPGVTFNGTMEVSKTGNSGTASSSKIKLIISEDGSSITSAEITLTDLKCPSSSSGSMTLTVGDPAHPSSIDEGKIEISASSLGKQTIEGQFTSPTEANGTATMTIEIPFEKPCDLGTWNWNAKAE